MYIYICEHTHVKNGILCVRVVPRSKQHRGNATLRSARECPHAQESENGDDKVHIMIIIIIY